MNRKQQVKKAISLQGPDYIPLLFVNKDKEQSDIIIIDVVKHFMGPKENVSEWGFEWIRIDETMGQPKQTIVEDYCDLEQLQVPSADDPDRFSHVREIQDKYNERYYIASLVLTGFTVMTFLRGFADTLQDFYINRDKVERLADTVFGFEEEIIRNLPGHGFDAVAFYDDWGTQNNLFISPSLWREFFKPRYRKQFELAHEHGLDVYFHSCGYIYDIIPDLIDTGVDLLNLGQPNLYDIKELGREFGGITCFVCPVSYQTTAITGTKEDIYMEADNLIRHLGCFRGGLIGYIEEYHSVGMSDANYRHCIDAFRKLGAYT
jgi:uroporphyrinogen decarboxylase